jgi:hypothetical protein
LTRRPGDLPEGDETLNNMQQVVLKLHNLPEQFQISANDISGQEDPSISDLFNYSYQVDPLPGKILKAIGEKSSFNDIMVTECFE